MPARRGKDFIPLGDNKVLTVDTASMSITHTYSGGDRGGRTDDYKISALGSAFSCPTPMSRVNLIALRNSSLLVKDCDYVVIDHVQGRLVAGTEIHMQAVSANKLSENVSVNTTYDNDAWAGIYDIDRALVTELKDNRNNIARGYSGNEVANFDWGNANITNTMVDNAVWTHTIGSPRIVVDLVVRQGATLTTTGWAGGSITGGTIIEGFGTNLNLTNANVSLLAGSFSNITSFNLSNFTGGSIISRYRLSSCSFNFSGSSSAVTINIVTAVGATFNHTGVSSGTVTGTNLVMSNNSVISHNNGAGNLSLNRVTLDRSANISHTAGVIALGDYKLASGAYLQQTGAANISLNNGEMGSQSNIINAGTVTVNGTRYNAASAATVNLQAGSAGTVTLTDTFNKGQINKISTSTAGNMSITGTEILNGSVIQNSGTGNLNVSDTLLSGNSRITLTADRGLTVTRGRFDNLVQITQSGTGTVVDSLIDSSGSTRGVYTFSASGATGNVLNYVDVQGMSASAIVSGTSTGQTVIRCKVVHSTFKLINNTVANSYSNLAFVNGCTGTAQNMTVAKPVNNVDFANSSVLSINNPTGVGNINNLVAIGTARININTTARACTGLYAKDRGVITFNGGTATDVSKQMAGTLTTGAFTHNNVVVINPISVTLTANNANTSSYRGVVSSTPTV